MKKKESKAVNYATPHNGKKYHVYFAKLLLDISNHIPIKTIAKKHKKSHLTVYKHFRNFRKKGWITWRPYFALQYFCMTLGYCKGFFKYIYSGKYKQVKEYYTKKPYLKYGEAFPDWG